MNSMECHTPMVIWELPVSDDFVRLSVRACAATGYFIVGCWCLLGLHKSKKLFMTCLAAWRNAVAPGANDDMEQAVSDMVSSARTKRAWKCLVIVGMLYVPYVANMLRRLHGEDVWGQGDLELMRSALFERGIVQRLFRSILFLCVTFRGRCSCFELNVLQVCVYFDIALQLWISPDTLTFALWHAVSAFSRAIYAIVFGNVPLTVSLNVVHCVAMFARVVTSSLAGELQNFMIFEVFTGILTIGVAVLYESLSRRQMRATLEASLATESQRTATELLSLVCDAVVTLDDDLRIKEPSPALAALLFRNTTQGLCGVKFEELICDDHDNHFEADMADCSIAKCLHVHLRDATGNVVAMQLFHRRLRGVGSQISHVVGIREEGDGYHLRQPPDFHLTGDDLFDTSLPLTLERPLSPVSSVTLSSLSSDNLDEPAFTVDAASPRLTLFSCTPSFIALAGPVRHAEVLDWVAGDSSERLCAVIEAASVGAPGRATHATFKLPQSQFGGKFSGRCEAHLLMETNEDGRVPVSITLTNVQVRRRPRKPSNSRGTRPRQIHRVSL